MTLIDISHKIDNDTPIYPGDYRTKLTKYKNIKKDYFNSYLLNNVMN